MSTETRSCCFAVRRVNPFVGVLQVLEAPCGRAVSADGVHWDLAIRTERPRVLGGLERDADGCAFIRFGLWSAEGGHAIANSRTVLKLDAELRQKFDDLVAAIARRQPEVPFTLCDSEELWLFDHTGQTPLALLATRLPGRGAGEPEPQDWRCSPVGAITAAQRRFVDARPLEALVKRRAGFNIRKGWVARQPDGSGLRDTGATRLEADRFPRLPLRQQWDSTDDAALVERYLGWSAPSLLTLAGIDDAQREWLEKQLYRQATAVEHHWRLYPRTLSPKRVKAARVQSRLMRARISTAP
jgi:hypothetical protein